MSKQINNHPFPKKPKIIFFGTPLLAVPALEALIAEKYEVLSVVTQPDRPKGRGRKTAVSPVKLLAIEKNIKVLQPEKLDDNFLEPASSLKPDLFVVIAFGQILSKQVLELPRWGSINIHASLLPRYRGPAPIQWTIINNEKYTGLTAMQMNEGLDTGPILMQQKMNISNEETAGSLSGKLAVLAPELLLSTLREMAAGTLAEEHQDNARATYAPKITKKQGMVDWSRSSENICGLIRGMDPQPGSFTFYNGKTLRLFGCLCSEAEQQTHPMPGMVKGLTEKGLVIETGKGCLTVREIQAPGKKRLSAKEFLNGSRIQKGNILGK